MYGRRGGEIPLDPEMQRTALEQADSKTSLERTAARIGDAERARFESSFDPAELQEPRRECRAERPGEMVATLAAVETRAPNQVPAATQRCHIDPQVAERRWCMVARQEGAIFPHERALGDQRIGDPDPQRPRQMVVAETRPMDRGGVLPLPEAPGLPPWPDRREGLQCLSQPRIRETVIAEPAMWLHGDQSAGDELGQVLAGRCCCHPTQPGQLASGADPAVEQRKEHGRASRVGQERGDCGDVTIGLCGRRLASRLGGSGLERADRNRGCHACNLPLQRFGRGRSLGSVRWGMRSVSITPPILYFGTPVVLLSTSNPDGTPNLAPLSSPWALGWTVVLGLTRQGQTLANLERTGECVLNLPSEDVWEAVERLAPLTGKNPPPERVVAYGGRFEPNKLGAAGLTPLSSDCVGPRRVAECPLQLEAVVRRITPLADDQLMTTVEPRVVRVHEHTDIVADQASHVDPGRWHPLIYNFRHYFGLGPELGRSFRATTPRAPRSRCGP